MRHENSLPVWLGLQSAAPIQDRRQWLKALALSALIPGSSVLGGCGGSGTPLASAAPVATPPKLPSAAPLAARSWRMGFGGIPPDFKATTAIQGIDIWSQRAEMAAIHEEAPWTELLAGADPDALLARDKIDLVRYYRAKGLKLLITVELNDGLSRDLEAPQLRALGRSLTEPEVQRVWLAYVKAVARLLTPDWLCLGAETNLVRQLAPSDLYTAVRKTANAAAAALHAMNLASPPRLLSSVQVECAWGRLAGQRNHFTGIATDLKDFPFSECVGLSSYPYLAYSSPEELPQDHYSLIVEQAGMPAMVVECGWSSHVVAGIASTPEVQARYVKRHAELLDQLGALAVVQLFFADLDLSTWQPAQLQTLPTFAYIGFADTDFKPKPALTAWDALHARPLT